ncbi:hypothetical protein PMIN01_08037 [Paraphaeosphaeria minitans]|uniref:Uncharacterized protein n=1 Tax=Paraphaeosphaeria minitans TaxID=565426 RepID=A0A9P6GE26_9PLEO|nr:hypothetical protein PMIN01_08037 [Paraphaeosphaeria minitans]
MTEVTPHSAMYHEDQTHSGPNLTDLALYADQIEYFFENFDMGVLEGFYYHEIGLPEENLEKSPWFSCSTLFTDPDSDLARPCNTQTLETIVDGGNRVDKVIHDFSDPQESPEEDLRLTEKINGEERNDVGNSVLDPANDIIELSLTATAITSDFSAKDLQSEFESRVIEQAGNSDQDRELSNLVQSACLKDLYGPSVVVLVSGARDYEAVSQNTIDSSFETHSSKTSLTSDLGTNGVAATTPTSTKLYGQGRKRGRSHEDKEADRVPRKRTLRSSNVVKDPAKTQRLDKNFVNINDHVKGLQSNISEALETLHQVLIATCPGDVEHLLNFSRSWKLHHTKEDAFSRIMPKPLETLRKNFDRVLQLPDIFPGNNLIRQSCSDLDEAFTEYDSLHLQLISEPRPRPKRVSKVSLSGVQS